MPEPSAPPPCDVIRLLRDLFADQIIRKEELHLWRQTTSIHLRDVVQELIEHCTDPDLQNRADDLMRVHAWVEEMCDLHDV